MRLLLVFICLIGFLFACRRSSNSICHAQILAELVIPIYLEGTPAYQEIERYTLHCAGKCPDGTPCDTIGKVTMFPDSLFFKSIYCGCKNLPANPACNIMLQHYWNQPDSVHNLILCLEYCPGPDTCVTISQLLTPDTIRSRISGTDSIIIKKKVMTCECMEV